MTPWYLRKKMWVGVVTAVAMITSDLMNNPELATKILAIGMTLIGGFSLEDMGKGKQEVIEVAKKEAEAPKPDPVKVAELVQKMLIENPELLTPKV